MDGDAIPQRKRGRPRVIKDSASSVTAWVSTRHHDRLSSIARRHDVSVSALVRRAIFIFLNDDTSGQFPTDK
jgi:hypothetical protein